MYLGDYASGSTVYCPLTTNSAVGAAVAPSSAFEAADVRIYKDGSATQRSSASGVTMTSPFDSITGLHALAIDTSDNADAGFYATGHVYTLVLVPDETVDGQAIVAVLGSFSIEYGILWDYAAGTTVRVFFTTNASTGAAVAPSTAFESADVRIYKDGSATQRSSASGVTMTSPFDSVTGLHLLEIDTSDNADPLFYLAGHDYSVVLSPDTETVDSQTVVAILMTFSIENRDVISRPAGTPEQPAAATTTLALGTYTFPIGFKVRVDPESRAIPTQKLPMADGARSIQGYLDAKVFIAEGNIYVGPMNTSDYRTRLDAFRAAMAQGPCNFYLWSDRYYRNVQAVDRTNYGPTAFGRLGDVEIEVTCPDPYQYSTTESSTTEAIAASGEVWSITTAGNAPSVPQFSITVASSGAKTIHLTVTNGTTLETFTLTGNVTGGDVIVVDCLEHTVTIGATSRMDLFDGQWVTLAAGANTLEESYTGDAISQIVVTRRNRWY